MRWLGRLLRRVLTALVLFAILLALPVIYVETMCRPQIAADAYQPVLPPETHRAEARTLMTYPEWHIVHAYDDYATTIATGNPHDFSFFRAITQYWFSLCTLARETGPMGGIDGETRQLVHVIGVSFSAELVLKAAYEESIGRVFTMIRGQQRSPLDELSARQAADYARFLQQVPWYKWDFRADIAALEAARTESVRDQERRFALGAEYSMKSAYAGVIGDAVAAVGPDELTLRMIVSGASPDALASIEGVQVVGPRPGGVEIETVRYRALTGLMDRMAVDGVDFVEIAGNNDILLTVLSPAPELTGALMSLPRQGYGDTRHLLLVKVAKLGEILRTLKGSEIRLEHIHDY